MVQFKHVVKQVEALNFLFSKLELQSGLAKRCLLESAMMADADAIEKSLAELAQMQALSEQPYQQKTLTNIKRKLLQIRDIKAPLTNLAKGLILDDIELFEVKNFCLLAHDIAALFAEFQTNIIIFPNLIPVLDLLDPDKTRIPNFYIYDSYSKELAALRTELKIKTNELNSISEHDSEQYAKQETAVQKLFSQSIEIEDRIRENLTARLNQYGEALSSALNQIARLDILIAKCALSKKYNLIHPTVSQETTTYQKLFNPHLQSLLAESGKKYQPVDIQLPSRPCLITGANMAGKTVLLKTLQLTQYLFQFGFFVPAEKAQICVVDDILCCMEDEQAIVKGLSSFAAEILHIDEMMEFVSSGKKALILIDELAHTTNPIEGSAIVNSVLDFFNENHTQSVVTTHFTGITAPCKKLRVKGFTEVAVDENVTPNNVNDFMDYSLVEDDTEQVPMEALHIAKILGVNEKFLKTAQKYLKKM